MIYWLKIKNASLDRRFGLARLISESKWNPEESSKLFKFGVTYLRYLLELYSWFSIVYLQPMIKILTIFESEPPGIPNSKELTLLLKAKSLIDNLNETCASKDVQNLEKVQTIIEELSNMNKSILFSPLEMKNVKDKYTRECFIPHMKNVYDSHQASVTSPDNLLQDSFWLQTHMKYSRLFHQIGYLTKRYVLNEAVSKVPNWFQVAKTVITHPEHHLTEGKSFSIAFSDSNLRESAFHYKNHIFSLHENSISWISLTHPETPRRTASLPSVSSDGEPYNTMYVVNQGKLFATRGKKNSGLGYSLIDLSKLLSSAEPTQLTQGWLPDVKLRFNLRKEPVSLSPFLAVAHVDKVTQVAQTAWEVFRIVVWEISQGEIRTEPFVFEADAVFHNGLEKQAKRLFLMNLQINVQVKCITKSRIMLSVRGRDGDGLLICLKWNWTVSKLEKVTHLELPSNPGNTSTQISYIQRGSHLFILLVPSPSSYSLYTLHNGHFHAVRSKPVLGPHHSLPSSPNWVSASTKISFEQRPLIQAEVIRRHTSDCTVYRLFSFELIIV